MTSPPTYLAGPMSGYEEHNLPAFAAATKSLRQRGFRVVSPAELTLDRYGTLEAASKAAWHEHLRADIAELVKCKAVAVMPGWTASKGATLEVEIAWRLGMLVFCCEHIYQTVEANSSLECPLTHSRAVAGVRTPAGQVVPAVGPPAGQPDLPAGSSTVETPSVGAPPEIVSPVGPAAPISQVDQDGYDAQGRWVNHEDNPLRQYSPTGGMKDNRGKARVDLIPSKPLVLIGDVLGYGARKYQPNNWRKGLGWEDTYGSLQRHLIAWHDGEETDPETGLSHLAHAGCQLLFLIEYVATNTGTDDRWKGVAPEATS